MPDYLGRDYATKSVEAARKILEVTDQRDPGGPWATVGVGGNSGRAFFSVVANGDELVDMTALGDGVNVAARSEPTAANTTLRSSMRCSRVGNRLIGTRSESPVPRLSNMISRLKDAGRFRYRALSAIYQARSTCDPQPGTKTRSSGPSPTTW